MTVADLSCRPLCGRCRKSVDRLTEHVDEFLGRVVFVAYCHGDTERTELELGELEKAGASLQMGVAFRTPRLLTGSVELSKINGALP